MSAWYILSSLGIYPACPGSGEYQLVAPLFKEAVIKLGNGKTLTIQADHPEHPYIADVRLNGAPVERNFLRYEEIMEGGTLSFTLSATPDHSRDALPAPYSLSTEPMVSTPYVLEDLNLFRDKTTVTLASRTPGAVIRYTLDGSEPTPESPEYGLPFEITKSCRIKARAFHDGYEPSPVLSVLATKALFREPTRISGLKHGCRYTYHRGSFSYSADVLASPAASSGVMPAPSIRLAPDEDHFGYVFSGYLDVPEDGIWDFTLVSDDGAVMDIDGTRVVDNDGSHSAIAAFGRIPLKKGLHPYRLIYLEDYEGQALFWTWRAPGQKRFSRIPAENLYH
jgi:hypothetical protein